MLDTGRLRQLSLATQIGLGAVALSSASAAAAAVPYAAYLGSLPPRAPVGALELVLPEVLYRMIALAQSLAIVGTAILFIAWFHRMYSNVAALTGRPTLHDDKWTIWGFIVPGLNLFRPQQIMRESWDTMLQQWLLDADLPVDLIPRDLVGLWWGTFLGVGVINIFAARFGSNARIALEELFATRVMQVADIFEVIAAVVAILMVRNVTRMQQTLFARPPALEGVRA